MSNKIQSVQDIAKTASQSDDRPIFEYDVPQELAKTSGIGRLGFVELNAKEELMAARRASGDMTKLAFELAKQSLRTVDDAVVHTGDESADLAWTKMGPKLRNLAMSAFNSVNQPREDDVKSFLASQRITAR